MRGLRPSVRGKRNHVLDGTPSPAPAFVYDDADPGDARYDKSTCYRACGSTIALGFHSGRAGGWHGRGGGHHGRRQACVEAVRPVSATAKTSRSAEFLG